MPAWAEDGVPRLEAGHVADGAIALDGRLDEPAWQQAGVIPDLTQRNPHPGEPTPYHTRVLVLHDSHTLYIGIVATDPDLGRLATHTLVRDGDQTNDDGITFVLDSFGSKRVAYVFQVNAAGAMADALLSPTPVSTSSNGADYNWDGRWQASVSRDAQGWTAEIAIDTRSLQFGDQTAAWGFNISRYVPRELLSLIWSGITLDTTIVNLQREGELHGMQGMQQGSGLDFKPYGIAKQQTGQGDTSKAGFDLDYAFTPELAGLLTYHTDFAEAEADQQQINTTRFALSFPEKRQFFLEGSNLFSFGYKLNGSFIPYYSRTLGLVSGLPVPLDEGVKLIGQGDAGSLAILDTRMGDADGVAQSTNLFAGRATYNLDPNLQWGVLVTRGDPTGHADNSFAGTDVTWKTASFDGDKNLNLSAWGGHSSGDLGPGNGSGYGVGLEYPNDLWYFDATYNQFGDALDPGIGFLPRPGTRQDFTELTYGPRPGADSWFNWVSKFLWDFHYSETDGLAPTDGGKQSSEWWFSPAMITKGGYYLAFSVAKDTDAPHQAFPLSPNVTVPAGQYAWYREGVTYHTPYSLPLVVLFSDTVGTYYSGTEQVPMLQVNWNLPSGQLQLNASHEVVYGHMATGDFITRLSSVGATYSFTPDLYVSTLAQYATGIPGVSLNARLRWIVDGASNIYLVWNRGLVDETNGLSQPVVAPGNEVILKLQWDFRA